MRSRKYTIRGCTIEVPKGGQSATVTKPGGKPVEFANIVDGPTAEVQAQRLAMDLPAWEPTPAVKVDEAQGTVAFAEPVFEATTDEPTDLDEATDGE